MDDLLAEFLTETHESLDVVDVELVRFEQDPNDTKILANIFRLVHTIKGTCGFLGLPRLEALAHAAETLMGKFRDGAPVTPEAVSLVLASLDRIKAILAELEALQQEPEGSDRDLIDQLERMAESAAAAGAAAHGAAPTATEGTLVYQVLERSLRPGEVSLDELERAFRETPAPAPAPVASRAAERMPKGRPAAASEARPESREAGDEAAREGKISTIRVGVDTLERLMTRVSELVLTRNQLLEIARRHEESEFKVPLQRLSQVTAELQESVMKTRMQPIGHAWQKLPRIVRDLAQELGKKIELDMRGAETELDRQVLELVKDPLTHMVRNSADHGLERAEERRAKGKPETGLIRLSAYHEGGHIIIEIADDGRGLDSRKIRAKVLDKGLAGEAELDKMSEAQIHNFIFAPGFSTAEAVTSVSGRGVGMDVVRTNVELIGGSIEVKTVPGEGTTFTVKIPLTLAIVSALIVEAAGERFAIPQLNVLELVRVQNSGEHRIESLRDTPVLRLRGKLLPLVHLRRLLGLGTDFAPDEGFVVVSQVGQQVFGLVVDGVFHTEEIVVKPMPAMLRHLSLFSGNTILGDGSVIMILDPNGVAQSVGATASGRDEAREETATRAEDEKTSFLVFRAGSPELKAVPLSLVTRLEEVDASKIERANGRDLVQYRGRLMPLVPVEGAAGRREKGSQPMLVFSEAGRSLGLLVDEIVDIVEARFDIEVPSGEPGRLGSAVLQGRAMEILDAGHYVALAFGERLEPERADRRGRRLLLVDDSPFFRNMLAPVLKAAGYDVAACASAEDALGALEKGGFDVIVSDIEMPGMSGFELAEAVRAAGRATPLIALSSRAAAPVIERGPRAGFRDFVAKFDRQGLIAALKDTAIEFEEAA